MENPSSEHEIVERVGVSVEAAVGWVAYWEHCH